VALLEAVFNNLSREPCCSSAAVGPLSWNAVAANSKS